MSVYSEWMRLSSDHADEQSEIEFWEGFLKLEQSIYDKVLNEKRKVLSGSIAELAQYYSVEPKELAGFLDGINDSLVKPLTLEELEESTQIDIEIDWEKLFYNMVQVDAKWLYTLKGWDEILDLEKRKQIIKEYKKSKTVVKEEKIGRNDPCPCGSGKKYKKCCGK